MILFNKNKYLYKCISLLKDEEELLIRDIYYEYLKTSTEIISKILEENPRIFSKLTCIICQQENIILKQKIPWKIILNKSTREKIENKSSPFEDDIYMQYGRHFNNNFLKMINSKEYIPLESNIEEHNKILKFCIPRDEQAVKSFKKTRRNEEDIIYYIYSFYTNWKNLSDTIIYNDSDEDKEIKLNGKWYRDMGRADDYYARQSYIPEWDEDCESLLDRGYLDDFDYSE